mmetsp:Transcript_27807/g.36949  ORF Transcript_27807/g.36949 Transcript_27807/m.36949 type:complete len:133 (-) Transcript_27807:315-713(-)|eukprot:15333364-Ditylum_brightwellii.AAC.1
MMTTAENTNLPPTAAAADSGIESSPSTTSKREIEVATALMSIWGPCRGVSDAYLACVATSGLGMCKPIRNAFEQCASTFEESSREDLNMLGSHMCSHEAEGSEERLQCASQIVFAQHHRNTIAATSATQQNE